jgi:hypothetical protein
MMSDFHVKNGVSLYCIVKKCVPKNSEAIYGVDEGGTEGLMVLWY